MLFGMLIESTVHPLHTMHERACWSQKWARRILRFLRCPVQTRGVLPARGFITANHISYMDVLVLAALTPTIFVAKSDVRRWPLIGILCERAGVLFLDRTSMRAAVAANRTIADVLRSGQSVVVFPEGTTSPGETILPMYAALFQSALDCSEPIIPTWIAYGDATQRERIAYWGDMTLMPHLLQLMRLRSIDDVSVQFRTTGIPARHRTQASEMCRVVWEQMMENASGQRQEIAAA
ncbi:lysophospholipid acyltransferase family protein [Terriglobus roseus]|uniref:Lyso-ornithine lipid acyltransferase n=1 Tax=Terriglobus roseus TaxID=392734 RepID=A0A1G7M4F1_9BACT|nr:lysophospholipid acyltransferase family protein [Terriglobus roseus]SDF56678.1 lyso-ornithine lipid acyltransferase [Terriglobus roseus]